MPAADDRPTMSGGRGARARILEAARELFHRHGINATGIAELCVAAHVSKRTLYQHFASKDDVVVAYLASFADDPRYPPEAMLGRVDLSARARLLELFNTLADDRRPMRGCPFVNAAAELPDLAHPAHRFAARYKRGFAERVAGVAREAGARNAERVGRQLVLLYDGAAAEVVIHDSPEPAYEAQAVAAGILHAAAD